MSDLTKMSVDGLREIVVENMDYDPCVDSFDEMARRYRAAHNELLTIHSICECIAECPPESEADTWTVKAIKQMARRLREQKQQLEDKWYSPQHMDAVEERTIKPLRERAEQAEVREKLLELAEWHEAYVWDKEADGTSVKDRDGNYKFINHREACKRLQQVAKTMKEGWVSLEQKENNHD